MSDNSHQNARQYFDFIHKIYQGRAEGEIFDFTSLTFQCRINIVNSVIQEIPVGAKILDFGMGPAVFASSFVNRGCNYLGIDISPNMVEQAKKLNIANTEFINGDLDVLANYCNKMDVVIAIGLIDYLEDFEGGIKALAKCVKKNGKILLSFRNYYSLPRLIRDLTRKSMKKYGCTPSNQGKKAFYADLHETSFDSKTQLYPLIRKCGFDNFAVKYFSCSPFFFNFKIHPVLWKIWCRLDSVISCKHTRFFCSGGILTADRVK